MYYYYYYYYKITFSNGEVVKITFIDRLVVDGKDYLYPRVGGKDSSYWWAGGKHIRLLSLIDWWITHIDRLAVRKDDLLIGRWKRLPLSRSWR